MFGSLRENNDHAFFETIRTFMAFERKKELQISKPNLL